VLVDALKKGGLDVKTARQLYRSLYNSSQFTALPGGMWGFAAWYPERVKNKGPKPSITDEEVDSVVDEALSDSVEDDGMAEEAGAS
jgi:hypothetical protein